MHVRYPQSAPRMSRKSGHRFSEKDMRKARIRSVSRLFGWDALRGF
jgi:hypothetical protein